MGRIIDRLALPLLALLDSDQARRLGLTPLDDERVLAALAHVRGRLLDIGCGTNPVVRRYGGEGVGVDVFPWPEADLVVPDCSHLPFHDGTFDTVTILAALNHMVNRDAVLAEAHRVLRPGGRLLVTMINPVIGWVVHRVRKRMDPDQTERGIAADERLGLWSSEVRQTVEGAGFRVTETHPFVLGLNTLYVAERQREE